MKQLRVLQIHNFYRSSAPSGENAVVQNERDLLERNNLRVRTFYRNNDELEAAGVLGTIKGAALTAWNPFTSPNLKKALDQFNPNIAHIHNTFPVISPSIFSALKGKAARVFTLHNYRIVCPKAMPTRNGNVCTACIRKRSTLPSLLHGCYRDSKLATLPLALNVSVHRALGTWNKHVDAFIVLSEFQKQVMSQAGIPEARIHVKPNFNPVVPNVVEWSNRTSNAVFVGRLSEEKGLDTLLEAWRNWGAEAPKLYIIGDGPDRTRLQAEAQGLQVEFLGLLPKDEAAKYIGESKLIVVPSRWFEGFPMVLQEAFAAATPALVSNIGPLPEIVGFGKAGGIFESGNPTSLLNAARSLWNSTEIRDKSEHARALFDKEYQPKANFEKLVDIYEAALRHHHDTK